MATVTSKHSGLRGTNERTVEFLAVRAGHQQFAVPTPRVREVMQLQRLVIVPSMPSYAKGMITTHGTFVPVVDLAARLGFPERRPTHRTCIVVVRTESQTVGDSRLIGLLVDAVSDILVLRPSDIIEAQNSTGRTITAKCRRKRAVKTVLDVDTLVPAC